MYIIIDIMEVYMESVKAFKFMNGWMVKHKDIDKIEEAIWVDRATAFRRIMCIWLGSQGRNGLLSKL